MLCSYDTSPNDTAERRDHDTHTTNIKKPNKPKQFDKTYLF